MVKTFDNWKGLPFRLYCRVPVPPDAVTVIVEVEPVQTVGAEADAIIGSGSAVVTDAVEVHPLASFTVTV